MIVKRITYRLIVRVRCSGTDWTSRILQNIVLFYTTGFGHQLSDGGQVRILAEVPVTLHAATMELQIFVPVSDISHSVHTIVQIDEIRYLFLFSIARRDIWMVRRYVIHAINVK